MTKLTVAFRHFPNAPTTQEMLVDGMSPYILAFGKFNIKKSAAKSLVCKLASHLSQKKFFLKAKVY